MTQILKILKDRGIYMRWMINRCKITHDQAEEYMSQFILKLLEKDHVPVMHHGYVYSSLRNMIIDDLRKNNPVVLWDDVFDPEGNEEFDICDYPCSYPDYKQIRPLVYSLTGRNFKEFLIMKFAFKMLHKEIADFAGISLGTVAPTIKRAQRELKRCYQYTI